MLDKFNTVRRYIEQKIDQCFALIYKKINPLMSDKFDGDTRFALITVNFSTTYYLKLMLLTLCEQQGLDKISKIVVVDNKSGDGGADFLKRLAAEVSRVFVIENHFICTHARGLRIGINYLQKLEKSEKKKSNAFLVCDTDIVFRNTNTLTELVSIFDSTDTAFAGELRYSSTVCPQAQASFLCVRRDCYARSDVAPFVNHGSPAFWMQRSLWRAGLHLHDFRSNYGGYILHRGRTGVAAANKHHRLSSFTTTANNKPHFMGVENGQQIWQSIEDRYAHLLLPESEDDFIEYLAKKLN